MEMDISIDKVRKKFGLLTALDAVSLQVAPNELFGVIGPDGAGKTTLFRILTSLLVQDDGKARVLGFDVVTQWRELRPQIGYMPGRFSLYPDLSVIENLQFFASIFGVKPKDNYDLIKPIYRQLEPFESRRVDDLSGGMKQKLALCCALIHRPRLLVLDEPTTGVDAVSRKEFWKTLKRLKNEGLTIVVSTPYMDEAAQCDRIGLIEEGKFRQVAPPDEVARSFDKELYAVRVKDTYPALRALKSWKEAEAVHPFGDSIHVTVKERQATPDTLDSYLRRNNLSDVEVRRVEPTIEDRFMDLLQSRNYADTD